MKPNSTVSSDDSTGATTSSALDLSPNGDAAKKNVGRRLATLFMAVVAAGVLGMLVWRERAALQQIDLRSVWPAVIAGQVLFLGGLALAACIWGWIMRAMGSRVAFRRHLNIYATTYLARLLPGTVWYVVGRGVLYQNEGEPARLSTVASGAEMLLTMLAGALVAVTSGALLLTQGGMPMLGEGGGSLESGSLWSAFLVVAIVAVFAGLALRPAAQRWLLLRLRLYDTPPLRPGDAARWMALFAVNWLVGAAILYMNSRALLGAGETLSILWILFSWSLVGTLSTFVFFLPSNFGLSEIGLSLLLTAVMPSSVAVLAAVMTRILQILYAAIGCAIIAAATSAKK